MQEFIYQMKYCRTYLKDVCFPVTKEFRGKLHDTIFAVYKQEKEFVADRGMA